MKSSDNILTFSKLDTGDKFTVDGFPGDHQGMAIVFTKTGHNTASEAEGSEWDFTNSQYLKVFKR